MGGSKIVNEIIRLLKSVMLFVEVGSGLKLRSYQKEVCEAVAESVLQRKGLTFVVMFPRQSGKNELQAQLETYLLVLFSEMDGEMVKVSPTWKPQSLNAMRRLERILKRNILTQTLWKKESGYIYRIGSARIYFLSGNPEANIVGATASTLLEVDEAQDVQISKFDKDVLPMAASTNATTVFWGTAWTSRTLLARELRAAREAENRDGIKRVFVMTADDVSREVPSYRRFVEKQVAKLGRNHPLVKTQYYSEEIDAEGGMFPRQRQALMTGEHALQEEPEPGKEYAILLDVAGEDEGASEELSELSNAQRDLTALTVVECDLSLLEDELVQAPIYRAVKREQWIGNKHSELYAVLRGIIDHWGPKYVVVDATGVGAGLCSFLQKAYPDEIIPFVFTSSSKSKLGWDFLGICDTGRWKEAKTAPRPYSQQGRGQELQAEFFRQCTYCEYVVLDGPGKLMRWGVPDGTRDTATGEPLHDDLLISAALCSVLDEQEWSLPGETFIIQRQDPLAELDEGF